MNRKLLKNYKGSTLSLPAHGRVGARATSSLFQYAPPPEKIAGGFQQAGKKEGGLGEGIFARLLEKRSPAALLVQSRVPQKSFLFLLEEKEIARQIKKCEENFFTGQRAKRAAARRQIVFGGR